MSKAEHTPGPWQANGPIGQGFETHWSIHHVSPGRSGGAHAIVETLHKTEQGLATAKANARLIAAAPELLAACQATLNQLDYLQRLWCKEGITDGVAGQLRAAINKATGEAS